MTKRELSRYYYLSKEIERIQAKLDEVKETYLSSAKLNGMPHAKSISSPQEKILMLTEKYQRQLEYKKIEAIQEMLKIETYLSSIEDLETRMIFNYRYIEKKSWEQIAQLMHMGIATVFRKHSEQLRI